MNLSYFKPLYSFTLLLFVLPQLVTSDNTIAAKEQSLKTANSPARRCSPGSYCGIYCLYAATKTLGKDVDSRALIDPNYVGSAAGSSLAELKKAAADRKEYDHYELFLETKDGQAKLYDPPQPVRLVPFYQLAPRWDGTGLIVSAKPIDLGAIFAPARKRFIMYAVIAVAVILSLRLARRHWFPSADTSSRRRLLGLSIAQGAGLAIAALLCGMVYHFVNDEGFLAHANATDSIQQAHLTNFIPKVSKKEIHKLLNTNAVFIDARLKRYFEAGHLEGAINVPVNASDDERSKAMVDIAKDARILVYCQSSGCRFAENVAIKLISDGFSNISLFKGDWRKLAAKSDE